jgi:hypothetical protein
LNILRDTHWINREKFSLKGRRLEEKVSILLKMEDGVDIGLTYYVPEKLYKNETFPVIFHQTRYYRNIYYRFPFNLFLKTDTEKLISKFISNGYAFVSIDVLDGELYGYTIKLPKEKFEEDFIQENTNGNCKTCFQNIVYGQVLAQYRTQCHYCYVYILFYILFYFFLPNSF